MAIDPDDVDMLQPGRQTIRGLGLVDSDAKLVLLQAGRDIGMGVGIDIRIDAQ